MSPEGVWFVYKHDVNICPYWMGSSELEARRVAMKNYAQVVFWPFGVEWNPANIQDERLTSGEETERAIFRMESLPPATKPVPYKTMSAIIGNCPTSWLEDIKDNHVHRCTRHSGHDTNHICQCGEQISPMFMTGE